MSGDPGPGPAPPVIEVWQEPNRLWRWRYLEPSQDGRPLAFLSNKEYGSREAALRSATTAYPDVAVLQSPAAGTARGRRGRRRRRLLLLAVLVLVILVLRPRRQRPELRRTSIDH
jgi:hypothetical protein